MEKYVDIAKSTVIRFPGKSQLPKSPNFYSFLLILLGGLGMSLGLMGRVQAQSTDLYVGSNSSGQTTNFTSGTNAYSNTYVGYATNASNNLLTITTLPDGRQLVEKTLAVRTYAGGSSSVQPLE